MTNDLNDHFSVLLRSLLVEVLKTIETIGTIFFSFLRSSLAEVLKTIETIGTIFGLFGYLHFLYFLACSSACFLACQELVQQLILSAAKIFAILKNCLYCLYCL